MDEETVLDFNFWPSFADLMLALVLILVLVLFLTTAVITFGKIDFTRVHKNQVDMIHAIAQKYGSEPRKLDQIGRVWGISSDNSDKYDIEIENDLNQQRITFSDKVLFQPDEVEINQKGQEVLTAVGQNLRNQLVFFKEIQIRGHADTNPTRYKLNMRLAAERAIAVFEFFRTKVGIDPSENLMSATSFGEFSPVQRVQSTGGYNRTRMVEDNSTPEQKSKNRRIELLLSYNQ